MIAEILVWYWIWWMMGQVPGLNGKYRGWRDELALTNGESQ
jgi:hypothetical protein